MSNKTTQEGIDKLSRYYGRLISLGALTFIIFVGALVSFQWDREKQRELDLAVQRVHESTIRLKAIIKVANDQVKQLAQWAADYPKLYPQGISSDLRRRVEQYLAANPSQDSFSLDFLDNSPTRGLVGNIIALRSAAYRLGENLPSRLDLGLSLLERFHSGQTTSGFFRWSYFFSAGKDFLAFSPWTASPELIAEEPDAHAFLEKSWSYEVTTAGLPTNNSKHRPYWTKAYLDQAGAGLMVSHGAPVYWGDEFVGVVAVDILLAFLSDFLREFPDPAGILLIANKHGQLLADRANQSIATEEPRPLDDILPTSLRSGVGVALAGGGKVIQSGPEHYVVSVGIDDPDWSIIFLLPQEEVSARIARHFYPHALVVVGLIAALALIYWTLRRLFVEPALAIAEYVASGPDRDGEAIPPTPRLWRPWMERIVRTFAERSHYLEQLRVSNELLEQRVAERTRELLEANRELERLATIDPLTSTLNRRCLLEAIDEEMERTWRHGHPLSVLLIDIDHFKTINDTYGHAAGDAALQTTVERIRQRLRKNDVLGRIGGEEFLVLLPETDAEGAVILANRLRTGIAQRPVEALGNVFEVTASLGIAQCRGCDETIEQLLHRADAALYTAKASGRNRVVVASADL